MPEAIPCPACGAIMTRVTSHEQCPRCGFILPCCDGDFVCASGEPMIHPNLTRITTMLDNAAANHEIGGAVMLVEQAGERVMEHVTGWAVREPESERTSMRLDTIFDLASITKVAVTMPAILQLVEAGKVDLDRPVGDYLEEFGSTGAKKNMTIRRLLLHTSGLAGWRGSYTRVTGIDAYIKDFAESQPVVIAGVRVEYSCLGYIMLGEVVHRISGQNLDAYAKKHILEPLGMNDTGYLPDPSVRDRIAATELGNVFEHTAAGAPPVQGWREYLLRGEVHDGNAWYGLGGVSGNAGLFGTARDLMRYGRMWLNGGELDGVRILSKELVAEAMREQTRLQSPNERRGLGWQMVPHPETVEEAASGRGLSPRAVGHTGFTGIGFWIDPDRELISVQCTNRVHPTVNLEWGATRAEISKLLADTYPV